MLADGDGEADIHLAADDDQGVGIEAAVGPHRELSPGPSMAHPAHGLPQEVGGAPNSGPGPLAAETSAPLRCRRRWPAAGDSPAGQCNHGDAPPPWPVRRSRNGRVQVDGQPLRRVPAAQARDSNSRLTRSNWRTWPHRKLRWKVPRVDGALTTQPMAPAVPHGRRQ